MDLGTVSPESNDMVTIHWHSSHVYLHLIFGSAALVAEEKCATRMLRKRCTILGVLWKCCEHCGYSLYCSVWKLHYWTYTIKTQRLLQYLQHLLNIHGRTMWNNPKASAWKASPFASEGGACDENKSAPYVNFRVATNFATLVNLVNSPTWISLIWHSIMFVSAGHKHTIVQGVRYVYVHFGCTHNLRSCGTICVYIYTI